MKKNSFKLIAGSTIFSMILGLAACGESNSELTQQEVQNNDTSSIEAQTEDNREINSQVELDTDTSSTETDRSDTQKIDFKKCKIKFNYISKSYENLEVISPVKLAYSKDSAQYIEKNFISQYDAKSSLTYDWMTDTEPRFVIYSQGSEVSDEIVLRKMGESSRFRFLTVSVTDNGGVPDGNTYFYFVFAVKDKTNNETGIICQRLQTRK